jgi:subtilisin family serine protease
MTETNGEKTGTDRSQPTAQGCSLFVLLVLSSVWVFGGSAIAMLITWSIEQAILDATFTINDARWWIMLAYGAILVAALFVVTLWTRLPRMKAVFRTWTLAAILALILAPVRLLPVTWGQLTALLQIAGLILYIFGLWFLLVRPAAHASNAGLRSDWSGVGLALMLSAIVGLPWVWIGALGSPLDTVLVLLTGLLFGIAASLLLTYSLLRSTIDEAPVYSSIDFGMDGFAAAMTLLILVTALGQNGNQWVLALVIPAAGWAAIGTAVYGRGRRASSSWPAVALLIGLIAAWPLMLVEPTELSVKLTSRPGELIGWVLRAGQYSLLLALLAGGILSVLRQRVLSSRIDRAKWIVAVVFSWVVLTVVYVVWGQPGFYGDKIFVVMSSQADLSQVAGIEDAGERRQAVYDLLVDHANQTQDEIRSVLDGLSVRYTPYYLENGLRVESGYLFGLWLARRADVDRVLNNPSLRPLPALVSASVGSMGEPAQVPWNLQEINADKVWEMGYRGQGIVIGQSDSGIQYDHPELADSYRGRSAGHDFNWHDAWFNQAIPYDVDGHGTHTLATAVGNRVGVAPDAEWIGCANMARNFGNPAVYLDCLQFLFAPFPHGGDPFLDSQPERGANVLNNSWGCPPVEGCDTNMLTPALAALRSAGVFVVVSAGNSGMAGCDTIRQPPAVAGDAFAVGAIDVQGNLAVFSSIGAAMNPEEGENKPDLVAPGVDVISAFPGNRYQMLSGTSMAAPHVTGTVTLMWSANPALIGKIDRTEEILRQTAQSYTGVYPECIIDFSLPNPAVGNGFLDAAAAVQLALEE